jgi:D-beta-D-heptose 7-phosphate kinase/D-beta-D-heptose 1-phosphate adenosyltransferase
MGKINVSKKTKAVKSNIFNADTLLKERFIPDYKQLKNAIDHCKGLGLKIVLTQGTWDLVHIGHARYFREAKEYGDVLVVGVDSDAKVRDRKGPDRPIVPQDERVEMITHMKYVDVAVIKELHHPKWHLIKIVRPDILIATKETYKTKHLRDLKKYCGKVVVLEPRATTSTSAKIRRLQISTAKKLEEKLTPRILKAIEETLSEIKEEKLKK